MDFTIGGAFARHWVYAYGRRDVDVCAVLNVRLQIRFVFDGTLNGDDYDCLLGGFCVPEEMSI